MKFVEFMKKMNDAINKGIREGTENVRWNYGIELSTVEMKIATVLAWIIMPFVAFYTWLTT